MHQQPSEPVYPARDDGVALVDGYGAVVSVERGHLVLRDGIAAFRRERRYARALCPFTRLVVCAHAGSVTLDALRWCADIGVGVIFLGPDQALLATTSRRELGVARIRRTQALAAVTPLGVDVARYLITAKVDGQLALCPRLPTGTEEAVFIRSAREALARAAGVSDVLDAEAAAAVAYWRAWRDLPIHFTKRDAARVPAHWRAFRQRASTISAGNRRAATPANALLNYTYRLLEAETTLALHAAGLDPVVGIFHADDAGRDSFSLDVMEAARHVADAYALNLIRDAAFRASDFHEDRRGAIRILPPLSHQLTGILPALQHAIVPVVEHVVRLVDRTVERRDGELRFSTPRRAEHRQVRRPARQTTPPTVRRCRVCGTTLSPGAGFRTRYCPDCKQAATAAAFDAFQRSRKQDARISSGSPYTPEAGAKRGAAAALKLRAGRVWEAKHGRPDPAIFRDEILPLIRYVPVKRLSIETGLSRRYCKQIRDGGQIPHAMHWARFRAIAEHDGGVTGVMDAAVRGSSVVRLER